MHPSELQSIGEKELARQATFRCRLHCCTSTACLASGSAAALNRLRAEVTAAGLEKETEVSESGCMGLCSLGPVVRVTHVNAGAPATETLYQEVTPAVATAIVQQDVRHGAIAEQFELPADIPFFTRQKKVVLVNAGRIDPDSIDDAIAHGSYAALARVVQEMTPDEVCDEITRSGLRGRGGAGYTSGLKWNLVRKAAGERKYVVANGDEGDPGAFMDRALMDSDPHRILEGMLIAGYATGAQQGFIYVRGEYAIAAKRIEKAIRAAERRGLLGTNILDSSYNFRIELRIGAGAFVCGEETALMASIMGRRGQPVPRPPFPAQRGLWGAPTLINNVETMGNVPAILLHGAGAFAAIGTEKSKGTKIFALTGRLKHTGLIEVPMGITLREIVEEIGGGIADGRHFKAAQTGGPSGGCIPAAHLDTPVDYETLRALGSIMGSGGLIVMDERSCMVDVARFFMEFCMDESCGKCVPCRVGTVQMHQLLQRITAGQATLRDVALLRELCEMVRESSLCGLGQSAPNPVLSTLRYFPEEYEAHVLERRCVAGVCKMDERLPAMAGR